MDLFRLRRATAPGAKRPPMGAAIIGKPADAICVRGRYIADMSDRKTKPMGFANFAKSYADSAEHLIESIKAEELSLSFNGPVDFLVAHALGSGFITKT